MHDIFVWKFRHFYGQSRGEVTSVMQLPNDSNQQQQSFDFYHPNFNSPTTSDVVESSLKETNKGFNQYKIVNNNNDNPESRIYFSQIAAIANAIANQLRPPITVTSTTTVTITRKIIWTFYSILLQIQFFSPWLYWTETSRTTLVRTLSFFILGCTPNPFPFATCPVKRILGWNLGYYIPNFQWTKQLNCYNLSEWKRIFDRSTVEIFELYTSFIFEHFSCTFTAEYLYAGQFTTLGFPHKLACSKNHFTF